jgi:hypothetical protein
LLREASHLSLFTFHKSLPLSLLTNHFSPLTAALAAQRIRIKSMRVTAFGIGFSNTTGKHSLAK